MSTEQDIVAGLLSVISSFVAGLLGAGGDILYVPLLLYGLPAITGPPLQVHVVTALSLVGSLASTGGGGLKHWRDGNLDSEAMGVGWKSLATGALAGGVLSRAAPSDALLVLFAIITIGAAGALFVPPREHSQGQPRPRKAVAAVLMGGVGLICGAVGVGGGFLIILVLLHSMRLSAAAARSTGLALTAFTAAPALLGKAITGQVLWSPVPFIVAGGLVGVWIGAWASPSVPGRVLRYALALLVAVLGVRVWLDVWQGSA